MSVWILALCCAILARAETSWNQGPGNWNDADHWSQGLPTPFDSAVVRGNGSVTIGPGTYLAGDLQIGFHAGDRSRVVVDGGQLILMQDSLRIGEYSGGEADFLLQDGAMHCVMDVFIGGASGVPDRATKASLSIQGGSFLGRTLSVGVGFGSEARITIQGSRASAVHVLDYVYLAGKSTLAFVLDEHGVTPITIQSRTDGLRIIKDQREHCRLEIALTAVPPREDITLVATHVATRGTFDDLPEGSELTAPYQGRTYRWALTYRGGAAGHDLVLKNRSEYAPDAPLTHVHAIPPPPAPLWRDHPLFALSDKTGEPAFAGAEGFGAFTRGGRGGKTIYVENLHDSGPGSLRAAIETTGPRTILFRVAGVIPLQSTLIVRQPFLTIDGQHAGITIRNHGIAVRTHDVVLRYLRIRVGDDNVRLDDPKINYQGGDGEHALYFDGASNCIADHLSLSWSTTKVLSVTKMSDLITVQYCILSEALNFAGHGYASLAGGNRVTWHHNLFAHNLSRNVRFQGPVDADFRNNVIYDWGHAAAYGEFDRVNYVGNYLKPGPSTTQKPKLFHDGVAVIAPQSLYVAGNIFEGDDKVNQDNWRGMGYYDVDRASLGAPQPFPAPPVTLESAQSAYDHVLQDAGATLPARDPVDTRVVREVREGSGHIINWVREVN
jgi:pectate lyase